jgi:hypothetical protein
MSNYVQSTNFATKDALSSGDPLKIVKGTEINTEFANIAIAVATKADLASPSFTGTPAAPTASAGANSTQLATTAYADAAITAERTATATLTNKSLTSPTMTGIPVAPTASAGTNTTQVATTAFVQSALSSPSAGSIGSYMTATYEGTSNVVFGDTVSGSLLRPVNIGGTSTGSTQTGTWRCLGMIVAYGGVSGPYTPAQIQGGSALWLRIS